MPHRFTDSRVVAEGQRTGPLEAALSCRFPAGSIFEAVPSHSKHSCCSGVAAQIMWVASFARWPTASDLAHSAVVFVRVPLFLFPFRSGRSAGAAPAPTS